MASSFKRRGQDVSVARRNLNGPKQKHIFAGAGGLVPSGDVKIGNKDYSLLMNNHPDVIATINQFPIKQIDGRTVFVQDGGFIARRPHHRSCRVS
jgi:hypothetical protein